MPMHFDAVGHTGFYVVQNIKGVRDAARDVKGCRKTSDVGPILNQPGVYPALIRFSEVEYAGEKAFKVSTLSLDDLKNNMMLSKRTVNNLIAGGVSPFRTRDYTESQLLSMDGIGFKAINEIRVWEQIRGYCRLDQDSPARNREPPQQPLGDGVDLTIHNFFGLSTRRPEDGISLIESVVDGEVTDITSDKKPFVNTYGTRIYRNVGHWSTLLEDAVQFNLATPARVPFNRAEAAHRYILEKMILPHCNETRGGPCPEPQRLTAMELYFAVNPDWSDVDLEDVFVGYRELIDLWLGCFDIIPAERWREALYANFYDDTAHLMVKIDSSAPAI